MPKCIQFGWFLPYSPTQNEYSAWKQHYISCAIGLDYLTPRQVTEMYGFFNESKSGSEEEVEKRQEKDLQKHIRERLARHKSKSDFKMWLWFIIKESCIILHVVKY